MLLPISDPGNKTPAFYEERPWGKFLCFGQNIKCTAKVLILNPKSCLSLQYHDYRDQLYLVPANVDVYYAKEPVPEETNMTPEEILAWSQDHLVHRISMAGETYFFRAGYLHRVCNFNSYPVYITEVAYGHNDEEDIVRVYDMYNRGIL